MNASVPFRHPLAGYKGPIRFSFEAGERRRGLERKQAAKYVKLRKAIENLRDRHERAGAYDFVADLNDILEG